MSDALLTQEASDSRPREAERVSPAQGVILVVILCVGALVRFWGIAGPSLWMDEIWSIEISTGRGSPHDHLPVGIIQQEQREMTGLADAPPWWDIWTHMNGVTHPPLYHLVLRWWMDLFGNSEAAVRSLSALLSVAAIWVLWDACRIMYGNWAGLLAAALSAVGGATIEMARDARSYSMLILLGLCCIDLVVRIEKFGTAKWRLIGLALFLAAAALTHYFAAWGIVALAIYVVLRLRGPERAKTLAAFVAAGLFAAALWMPWFIAQLHSLPSLKPDFLVEAGQGHVMATITRMIELPAVFVIGQTTVLKALPVVAGGVTVFIVLSAALGARKRPEFLIWVIWLFVIVGGVGILDLLRDSAYAKYVRYTVLAAPAVYAILAALAANSKSWRGIILLILAVAAYVALVQAIEGTPSKENWRHYSAMLDQSAGQDDLLVFYNDSPWITPGMWYMNFKYYAPLSRRPWVILEGPADAGLLAELSHQKQLWLIGNFPQRDAEKVLPGWKPADMEQREPTVGGICLLRRG